MSHVKLIKRPLYKAPRQPARKKGIFSGVHRNDVCEFAPGNCKDANAGEVSKAIYALAMEAGVSVGRGYGYYTDKDEYEVIGKSLATGKAQDFKIKGEVVAKLIRYARILNGGPMVHGELTKQVIFGSVQ